MFYFDISDGAHLKKVSSASEFFSHPLTGTDSSFKLARQKIIDGILCALEKRFADLQHQGVFRASQIVKLSSWPHPKDTEVINGIQVTLINVFLCVNSFYILTFVFTYKLTYRLIAFQGLVMVKFKL